MKKLVYLMMMSCKKATGLIEKKSFIGLSWKEDMQLRLHIMLCDACTRYQEQSKQLDQILEKHQHLTDAFPVMENSELKENIIRRIGE